MSYIAERERKRLKQYRDSLNSNLENLTNPDLPNSIPTLLDKVSKIIADKDYYPILSNFYPQNLTENGGRKLFEVAYSLRQDGIYKILFDPSSDTVDSGDSATKKISKKEFLAWVKKDPIHILDVYNHLVSYIESPDQKSN